MGSNLQIGKIFVSDNGIEYEVLKLLGEGGQGEVYLVQTRNNKYALKWYHPYIASKGQMKILKDLIVKGPPDDNFLWPKDIVQEDGLFGYIMDLRPPSYNNLIDWMKRCVEPTFTSLCLSGFNIAKEFKNLHSDGWCYRDISWGNLFIDFKTGNVLICDNDNAVPNKSKSCEIKGTLGFMAPEIVIGTAMPSTDTDLFSLAILFFLLFNIHHPLVGKLEAEVNCWDIQAMNKLYGENPIFIWDPDTKSNRPVKGYQENAYLYWEIYPKFFKDLFIRAFTEGIRNPKKRSTESTWQVAFIRLLNSIITCPNQSCQAENFYDIEKQKLGVGLSCWSCQKIIPVPAILKIDQEQIMLNKNTKIRQHHARGDFCLEKIIGEVRQKPDDPTQWGIKNISSEVWAFTKPDGQVIMVDNGKTIPLIKGSKINFGINVGEII